MTQHCSPRTVPAAKTLFRTRPRRRLSSPAASALTALVATAVSLATVALPPGSAAQEAPGGGTVRVVGSLPVLQEPDEGDFGWNSEGWMVINPQSRRAYQFFVRTVPSALLATWVQSFDLDTLRPLRRVRLDGVVVLPAKRGGVSGELVHAVDNVGRRLFLPVTKNAAVFTGTGTAAENQYVLDEVRVLDERAFDAGLPESAFSRTLAIPASQRPLLLGGAPTVSKGLRGMTYHGEPGKGKLLMLFAAPDPSNLRPVQDHQLVQWGVDDFSLPGEVSPDDWSDPTLVARPCGRATLAGVTESGDLKYQAAILRTERAVHVVCQQSQGVAIVVGFAMGADGKPSATMEPEVSEPLPRQVGDTMADAGSGRLFVKSSTGGSSWWVYDTRSRTWTAALGVAQGTSGLDNSAGIDPGSGRLYALIPDHTTFSPVEPIRGGFRFADARLTPPPQLSDAPAIGAELTYPGQFRILVDPEAPGRPRRVFLRRGHNGSTCYKDATRTMGSSCSPAMFREYLVIEDRVPVTTQASAGDVDRYTADVAEEQGRTDANFDASGQGFGFRTRLTGGISAAVPERAHELQGVASLGSGCLPADRFMTFGAVEGAGVSNVATTAAATAADADTTTKLDAEDPVARCWPTPTQIGLQSTLNNFPRQSPAPTSGVGRKWNEVASECTGTGADNADGGEGGDGKPDPTKRFASSVACDQDGFKVSAEATAPFGFDAAVQVPAVQVGEAGTRTTVERKAGRGVTTTVDSWAKGVEIGGVGRIEVVRARAVTTAGGRPGTARSEFTRELCGVSIGTFTSKGCVVENGPVVKHPMENQPQADIIARFNERLAGRGEIRLRRPDAAYAAGSPGGYQAAIQRDRQQAFADTVITKDPSLAVPGLELIMYRDSPQQGAGRQIFQFAGVQASSQYGIYCLFGSSANGKACAAATADSFDVGENPTFASEAPAGLFAAQFGEGGSGIGGGSGPESVQLAGGKGRSLLQRLLAAPADVLRLLFSSPRELGLVAAVWGLIWLPCYLGERRRALSAAVAAGGGRFA